MVDIITTGRSLRKKGMRKIYAVVLISGLLAILFIGLGGINLLRPYMIEYNQAVCLKHKQKVIHTGTFVSLHVSGPIDVSPGIGGLDNVTFMGDTNTGHYLINSEPTWAK